MNSIAASAVGAEFVGVVRSGKGRKRKQLVVAEQGLATLVLQQMDPSFQPQGPKAKPTIEWAASTFACHQTCCLPLRAVRQFVEVAVRLMLQVIAVVT